MIVIGIDAHKRTHTLVAVDDVGVNLARIRSRRPVEATRRRCAGHVQKLAQPCCGVWRTVVRSPGYWSGI